MTLLSFEYDLGDVVPALCSVHDGRIVTIVFCLLTFVVASGFLVADGRCKTISGKGDLSVACFPPWGEKKRFAWPIRDRCAQATACSCRVFVQGLLHLK